MQKIASNTETALKAKERFQARLQELRLTIDKKDIEIAEKRAVIAEKVVVIAEKDTEIAKKDYLELKF